MTRPRRSSSLLHLISHSSSHRINRSSLAAIFSIALLGSLSVVIGVLLLYSHAVTSGRKGELEVYGLGGQCWGGDSVLAREMQYGGLWGGRRYSGLVYANSHNDEQQSEPLTHALRLGMTMIEADIIFYSPSSTSNPSSALPKFASDQYPTEPSLLIGHYKEDVRAGMDLSSMYLNPIMRILEEVNFNVTKEETEGRGWNGVYTGRGAAGETLKEDHPNYFPTLQTALQPLIARNWLTTFTLSPHATSITDGTLHLGPITIIGTGSTPPIQVVAQNPRNIFLDGPLLEINKPIPQEYLSSHPLASGQTLPWHPFIAPLASSKLPLTSYLPLLLSPLFPSPTPPLSSYINHAHSLGIQTRWWGDLRSPAKARRGLWRYFTGVLGVDWLNVDELEEVRRFEEGRWRREGGRCVSRRNGADGTEGNE